MAAPRLIRYNSLAEFRRASAQWNDLWQRALDERANVAPPSACAESIAAWIDHFAPKARFIALAVEHDGHLVAGLPLVQRRMKHAFSVGSLPHNASCWAGDLLIEPMADVAWAMEILATEIRRLPWPLLWFEAAPLQTLRWSKFVEALGYVGTSLASHEQYRIGTIEIEQQLDYNWQAYEAAWSGNHRRHMRKALRRANEEGSVRLDIRRPTAPQEVVSLLEEGFGVEHRSWKGQGHSSVLSNASEWSFYRQQAVSLAQQGLLELTFLRHQGVAIAFEYGWRASGVYYTPKVGFDDAYSRLSPGQMLRYHRYQQAFAERNLRAVDFLGPLSEATAKWATSTYPVSRLVVETGGSGGQALLWAYRHLWRSVRRWRRSGAPREIEIVDVEPVQSRPLSALGGGA